MVLLPTFLATIFLFPVLASEFLDLPRLPLLELPPSDTLLPDEATFLSNCSISLPSKIFSSGSQVEYFGPQPFHLTKYSATII